MEMELNSLINKIKQDGVQAAQRAAEEITKNAQEQAEKIIRDAQKKKAEIIAQAQEEAQAFRHSGEKALKQSARDVLLLLRERVMDFFDRIIKKEISEQLSFEVLEKAIVKAVENYRRDGILDIEVLVSPEDRKKLEKTLFQELTKQAKQSVELKGAENIHKGFRIGQKNKDSYLDFSDEALAEAFKRYLHPQLAEKLDISLGISENDHAK